MAWFVHPGLRVPVVRSAAHLVLSTGLALATAALVTACDGRPADDEEDDLDQMDCVDGKCDLPGADDHRLCEERRADAFDPNQQAYRPDFIRWSCDDVAGVSGDDRGQEYCEYFAIAQLPPAAEGEAPPPPSILGRNLGADETFGTTEPALTLTYDQIAALERDESAIAGQCVFTSWNNDIPGRPVCKDDVCPSVLGVVVSPENFRMQFQVNSFDAALELVGECREGDPIPGDPEASDDPRHDPFTRGCLLNAEINDTAYRKSDTFVCAASNRFSECGCEITVRGLVRMIAGPKRRGFPLGTWSSPTELPPGCRHVDLGDGSQTLVACDLTAGEVITYGLDLRAHCQAKYADNVVVHVAMPLAADVTCDPRTSTSPYATSCGATPWVLEP